MGALPARGILMGRIERSGDSQCGHPRLVTRMPIAPLKAGDGVVFDAADWRSPEEPEEGGRVYQVCQHWTAIWNYVLRTSAIDFKRIRPATAFPGAPTIGYGSRRASLYTGHPRQFHASPLQVHVNAVDKCGNGD